MSTIIKRFSLLTKICLFFFICLPLTVLAQEVQYPTRPTKTFYVDDAKIMDLSSMQKVEQVAGKLWQEEKIPLFVVTIPTLAAYHADNMTIESYANALFNHWGIGSKDRNYGILLLISKGDRKARIELGVGFAHRYDESSHQIMENIIIPQFKQGQFNAGISAGVEALDAMARGLGLPAAATANHTVNNPQPSGLSLFIMAIAGIGIIGLIISLFRSGRSGWGWLAIIGLGGLIWYFLSNNSNNGGGNDDSFGGGSSDGGGSTGSW